MAFPAKQNPLDWITQCWNIALGKRVVAAEDAWLVGPIGAVEEEASRFVERIAGEKGLRIERHRQGSGLMENLDEWGISVSPKIQDFYRRTSDFELNVRTTWKPVFGSLGFLVAMLFSRRIQQLNLPHGAAAESAAFESQIIKLVDSKGSPEFTLWQRCLRETGEVVFLGIYTSCRIPSGAFCVKAIFPLPRGSATVLFRPESDAQGNLLLVSSGKKYGDPGFYFLVEDAQGCLWKHYLPSFRQSILLSEGADGILKAEHTLKLWSLKVYSMIYDITERPAAILGQT